MSAPALIPQDPAEAIAFAIVGAERRLWLLKLVIRFCMALRGALKPGGAADALLASAKDRALVAISRAVDRALAWRPSPSACCAI